MRVGCGIIILFFLASCSHRDHNLMIQEANHGRLEAYGTALAKQRTEGGRMALTLTYALGVGQQKYVEPETPLTYAKGLLPYARLFMDMWMWGESGNDGNTTYHVEGSNNYLGVTNDSGTKNTAYSNSYNTEAAEDTKPLMVPYR